MHSNEPFFSSPLVGPVLSATTNGPVFEIQPSSVHLSDVDREVDGSLFSAGGTLDDPSKSQVHGLDRLIGEVLTATATPDVVSGSDFNSFPVKVDSLHQNTSAFTILIDDKLSAQTIEYSSVIYPKVVLESAESALHYDITNNSTTTGSDASVYPVPQLASCVDSAYSDVVPLFTPHQADEPPLAVDVSTHSEAKSTDRVIVDSVDVVEQLPIISTRHDPDGTQKVGIGIII